jgi:hypothetical protein
MHAHTSIATLGLLLIHGFDTLVPTCTCTEHVLSLVTRVFLSFVLRIQGSLYVLDANVISIQALLTR